MTLESTDCAHANGSDRNEGGAHSSTYHRYLHGAPPAEGELKQKASVIVSTQQLAYFAIAVHQLRQVHARPPTAPS
jgi:hypothetical protein